MGARWKYFRTVVRHRRIVRHECFSCGLYWRGLMHDLSKYFPVEFSASAKYFQGNRSPIEAEKEACGYSAAWMHHKGHNPHHWEYWTDFGSNGEVVANKIPWKYVIEMVCDWIGAGKAYNRGAWKQSDPFDYYHKVRAGRHFHPDTERLIIHLLNMIKWYGLEAFHETAKDKNLRDHYNEST